MNFFPRIDRRLLANFDWIIVGLVLIISLIGVATIYSATRPIGDSPQPVYYLKQIIWLGIGLLTLLLMVSMDYRWIQRFAYPIFVFGVFLLALVLVLGRTGMGAQRWLSVGPISFQPSEIVKLFFIVAMARYLAEKRKLMGMRDIIKVFFVLLLAPLLLLLAQPDLGTGIMFVFIFVSMLLVAGISKRTLAAIILVAALAVPFLGNVVWSGLKQYQKNRIVAFMKPEADPAGIGYQITQSKITIGSAGFLGKGFTQGTQGVLRFLPEKHTDFIFSIFAEEWGFLGSVVLLSFFLLVLMSGLETARRAKDRFGYFVSVGVVMMLFFYLSVNIGMTLGLAPVVGVPLPFMSYGGTSLVSNFLAIALLVNVRMRRFELFY